MNVGTADDVNASKPAPIIKIKASGRGKNRKPATNKLGSPVPVASAVYSVSDDEVILTPRTKLTASKPEELVVNGALITDTLGRDIDGGDNGQAGSDYIATITGTRVTAVAAPLLKIEDGGLRTEENRVSRARIEDRLVASAIEIHLGR